MSTYAANTTEYASLSETDAALEAMMTRLLALLEDPLTDAGFVEIAAIYDNVAYVFLYLESNAAHIDYRRVLPWRDRFYKNAALNTRIRVALTGLRCGEPDIEEARQAYVEHLNRLAGAQEEGSAEVLERLLGEAKAVVGRIDADHAELMARLEVSRTKGRAWPRFYKLLSTTDNPVTRAKLTAAWTRVRDNHVDELFDVIDEMVSVRRSQAASHGYRSVLSETLGRCRVDQSTAEAFLHDYLRKALVSHAALEAQIADGLGLPSGNVVDHFARYVAVVVRDGEIPHFDLEKCLEYLVLVAQCSFGVALARRPAPSEHVIVFDAVVDGRIVGRINFDLWENSARPRGSNTTQGIRNRTEWAHVVQEPVAYVSCRFRREAGGASLINFQNVHSLFHEFGHAVNHLLIRRRMPNQSGLEYLPLERLENLSMWFEKWVYHPALTAYVDATPESVQGLDLARRVKLLEYRRTHLERGIIAALDFHVHGDSSTGPREAFAELDSRYDLSRYFRIGDFPGYFTWPMFQANPGAYFSYLWGAAYSAERFTGFLGKALEDLPEPADTRASFSACFDADEPSRVPDPAAIFAFYDDGAAAGAA